MKRVGLILVAALLGAVGCDSTEPVTPVATSSAQPTGAPPSVEASAPSDEPSPSAAPAANHFTVDGTGPYQLGAKLADLQAAGQVVEVNTGGEVCSANTRARGTGEWTDVRMSFRPDGKIYIVVNRSTSIPTPSGAWLGMSLAALQSIYGTIGEELTVGSATAYLVTTDSGRAILFDLDMTSKKVISMIAGDAGYLKSSFLGGTDYC